MNPTDNNSANPTPPNNDQPEPTPQPPAADNSKPAPPVSAPVTASDMQNKAKKGPFKKLSGLTIGLIVAGVLLVGSAAAYYFGYVVPNKPENIWKSALGNSAKGLDRLVTLAEEKQEEYKGGKIEGNVKITGGSASGDGTISARYDENSAEGTIDVGFAGSRYALEFRGEVAEGNETPDIYVKATGLDGLAALAAQSGSGDFSQITNQIEDQWILVDHTLIDSLLSAQSSNSQNPVADLSPEDVIAISRKVSEITGDYLFATNENAVLELKETVGKEDYEGRETYHYKVTANAENMRAYITALKDGLKETQLDEMIGDSYDSGFDEVIESIKDEDFAEPIDVWVDTDTKTIRNIRDYNEGTSGEYTDISLLYEGGVEYPFRIKVGDSEEYKNLEFTITVNTDTGSIALDANIATDSSAVEFDLSATPSSETFDIEEPSDAKSVNELMSIILGASSGSGIGSNLNSGSSSQLSNGVLNGFGL